MRRGPNSAECNKVRKDSHRSLQPPDHKVLAYRQSAGFLAESVRMSIACEGQSPLQLSLSPNAKTK